MKFSSKSFSYFLLTIFSTLFSIFLFIQPLNAQTLLCQITGIGCPQSIPGTSPNTPQSNFRLVTTYNRGRNSLASLGIKSKLYVDNIFTKLEENFVATAWAEFHLAVNDSKIKSCMAKYSTKTINNKRVASSRSGIKYLPETTRLPFDVHIKRYSQNSTNRGWAYVNSTGGNKLEINLNVYPISGGDSTNRITTKILAGVIGHELLHVYGFDHDKVSNGNFSPVFGNDVYESGWCIARGGKDKIPNTFGLAEDGSTSDEFVD